MSNQPKQLDDILDATPPHWAVERAMNIADITCPRITGAVVDLIAVNLWLAYTKGETAALNSAVSELRNAV